ncbi:hypothetical protein FH5_01832 [Priestia endophytica]|nr:hypothetical protein FH5_01832 [Priestia endophytica]
MLSSGAFINTLNVALPLFPYLRDEQLYITIVQKNRQLKFCEQFFKIVFFTG